VLDDMYFKVEISTMRTQALALLAMFAISAMPAQAATFALDKQHTEVRFSWDHLGLSRQSGKFGDVSGTVEFDEAHPENAKINVTIKVASVITGVAALDSHLVKSKEFFDTAAHPNITFKSREVRPTGEKTAEVTGDLTINGIAKPVTLAVVWNFLGPHPLGAINPVLKDKIAAGFSARTQILRSEWGLTRTIPLVSDEIRIAIEMEMLAGE
jgi:polyisoprenoid-binding protein YceI